MHFKKIAITVLLLISGFVLIAQEVTGLGADIREMSKETDPIKSVQIRNRIIQAYKLDTRKDAETIDLLNGTVAIAFALQKDFKAFEKYIALIKNKFNQTSMLSIAANKLLDKDLDAAYARRIAEETLKKYAAYKDDPKARPDSYTKEDWKRFMDYAKYPYYDTYAKALFANKRYKEALHFQRLAFDGAPEKGIPSSVERYAKLLLLNGERDSSKQFLLKVAGMGKLKKEMTGQLEAFYLSERGSNRHFDAYMDSLQKGIQKEMIKGLRKELLNVVAPPFSLHDIEGKAVQLVDFKGKIVVLDLWATWCRPCLASFPAMQKLVKKYPEVVFLFIAVDEKGSAAQERVKKFISKNNYSFQVLMDEPVAPGSDTFKITSSYKPDGIPAKYFIDKEGKLRFTSKGFDTDAELMNEMDAIITILKSL